ADPLSIEVARLRVAPAPERPRATMVALSARTIRLPEQVRQPLGREIASFSADGAIVEAIPRLPPAAALEAWRQAGGAVDVDGFRLRWGDLDIDGAVTLA